MIYFRKYLLFIAFLQIVYGWKVFKTKRSSLENERPIIGLLTQEVTGLLVTNYGKHTSYLAASYVKHLESAGARVVPIWIGQRREYYEDLMKHINGVLLPGGASLFNVTKGYAEAGKVIMDIAEKINEGGEVFPVWGTCLGFELMANLANNGEMRENCRSDDQALPLTFNKGFRKSKLFAEAPSDILYILATENCTINYHEYCVTEQAMYDRSLLRDWKVLSVNRDSDGLEFISSMEHRRRPYYGVQFHPEKSAYEWKADKAIPHDAHSIQANQYFADFFVRQARRSKRSFPTVEKERQSLIYNFPVTQGKPTSSFTQLYFFDYPLDKSTCRE